jgi:hypothetical protein
MDALDEAEKVPPPAQQAVPEGWTASEARKLVAARTALLEGDKDEAWHQLYWIVSDRAADPYNPWAEVEALAAAPTPGNEEKASSE